MSKLAVAPKLDIKLVPIPKTALYAGLSGEMVKTMGMTDDDQINALQQVVADGYVEAVIVRAVRPDGRRESIRLDMKPPAAGATVNLAIEPNKSLLETLDVSLAAAVHFQAEAFKRQGLKPEFFVAWSAKARADHTLIKEATTRLNMQTLPPEPPATIDLDPGPTMVAPPAPPPFPVRRYPQPVHTFTGWAPPPTGYRTVTVASIRPAKDPDVTLTIESTRKD
ncbi:MAG: hypothetical protein BGN89_18805 [Alphaproteobacteria bacterium 64-6]|nr:MAG: hypothetical protein BGN89_18805 [Alphaproteobacteria bacterium 64-6]